MKKILCVTALILTIALFTVEAAQKNVTVEEQDFASQSCKGFNLASKNRCMANYCHQADAVTIYKLISKEDFQKAKVCFKKVFEPCASACSAGNSLKNAQRCNALFNKCVQ